MSLEFSGFWVAGRVCYAFKVVVSGLHGGFGPFWVGAGCVVDLLGSADEEGAAPS